MSEIERVLSERFLLQKEYLGDNKPVNKIVPLVSVTVATYQQVDFIKACLDGILMQKTNFPYEIILGEDGSVDGTQEICKEYAERYPDKIRLFIRDRSLSQYPKEDGSITRFNGVWNRMSVRGKYIAFCEGDDYWIDPLKLQKQVDFLEAHPDYGLCYTNAKSYIQETGKYVLNTSSPYRGAEAMLLRNPIATLTVVYRKEYFNTYQNEVHPEKQNWLMGDYPMWLWFAFNSKIHYINECTAVYRILSESASHSRSLLKQEAFNKSVLNIRLYYQEHYIPDNASLKDLILDDYFRCNIIAGIRCNERKYCMKNSLSIKNSSYKDFVKRIFLTTTFLFKILRCR